MADFFGGIFDSLRSVGDDVSGFFDTTLGQALGKGAKSLLGDKDKKTNASISMEEGFLRSTDTSTDFRARETDYAKSNDFYSVERRWLERMNNFRSVVKETEVKK